MIYYCIILLDSKLLQKYKKEEHEKIIFIQNLNNIYINLKLIFVDYYLKNKEDIPLYSILSSFISFKYFDKKYNKRKHTIKFISIFLDEIFPLIFKNNNKIAMKAYDNLSNQKDIKIELIKNNEKKEEELFNFQKEKYENHNKDFLKRIEKFLRHSVLLIDKNKNEFNFHEKLEKYIEGIFGKKDKEKEKTLIELIYKKDDKNNYLNQIFDLTKYFIFKIKNIKNIKDE